MRIKTNELVFSLRKNGHDLQFVRTRSRHINWQWNLSAMHTLAAQARTKLARIPES
jgi:hypothetical protein